MRRPSSFETALLFLASLLFLVGAYMIQAYREQGERLDLLTRRADIAEVRVSRAMQSSLQLNDLKARAAALEAKLRPDQVPFPKETNVVALVEALVASSRQSGVQLMGFESREVVKATAGGREYVLSRYTVTARGQPAQFARFVASLEASSPRSLAIESVSAAISGSTWTATFDMALFAQAG